GAAALEERLEVAADDQAAQVGVVEALDRPHGDVRAGRPVARLLRKQDDPAAGVDAPEARDAIGDELALVGDGHREAEVVAAHPSSRRAEKYWRVHARSRSGASALSVSRPSSPCRSRSRSGSKACRTSSRRSYWRCDASPCQRCVTTPSTWATLPPTAVAKGSAQRNRCARASGPSFSSAQYSRLPN